MAPPTGDPNIPAYIQLGAQRRAAQWSAARGISTAQHFAVNDLPVSLNNQLMAPQTPAGAEAPYQAYFATGSVNWPLFVANCSPGKFSAEEYYQQMIMSQIERQEIEV